MYRVQNLGMTLNALLPRALVERHPGTLICRVSCGVEPSLARTLGIRCRQAHCSSALSKIRIKCRRTPCTRRIENYLSSSTDVQAFRTARPLPCMHQPRGIFGCFARTPPIRAQG